MTFPTITFAATYSLDRPVPPRPRPHAKSRILAAACQLAGISVDDCLCPRRDRDIVRRRWQVMGVLHAWGKSKSEIGRMLDRDHSTVIHALRKLEAGRG